MDEEFADVDEGAGPVASDVIARINALPTEYRSTFARLLVLVLNCLDCKDESQGGVLLVSDGGMLSVIGLNVDAIGTRELVSSAKELIAETVEEERTFH